MFLFARYKSWVILFVFCFTLLYHNCIIASDVKGHVNIDGSWEPVIYLSMINSFNDINTTSYDFLVFQAAIDSSGFFEMNDLILPEDDRLYRLHICKKGDPVSTIIIGGRDENYFHFIMNNSSKLIISKDPINRGFQYCTAEGHGANSGLQKLMNLQKDLQTPPALPSEQNRELLRQQIMKSFVTIADTSSYDIIKLLSIHLVNNYFESHDLELMEKVSGELHTTDTSNPYYLAFVNKLEYLKYRDDQPTFKDQSWLKWVGLVALILLIGLVFRMRTRPKGKQKSDSRLALIQTLSVQEKKVFELLRNGASNKEISSELNIEVSTVKSHVHKIFSRLGVGSRKEIINANWEPEK